MKDSQPPPAQCRCLPLRVTSHFASWNENRRHSHSSVVSTGVLGSEIAERYNLSHLGRDLAVNGSREGVGKLTPPMSGTGQRADVTAETIPVVGTRKETRSGDQLFSAYQRNGPPSLMLAEQSTHTWRRSG
jgi:hypothetical protein